MGHRRNPVPHSRCSRYASAPTRKRTAVGSWRRQPVLGAFPRLCSESIAQPEPDGDGHTVEYSRCDPNTNSQSDSSVYTDTANPKAADAKTYPNSNSARRDLRCSVKPMGLQLLRRKPHYGTRGQFLLVLCLYCELLERTRLC